MKSFKAVGARHLGIGVQSLAHTTGNEQKEWDDNESSISDIHQGNRKYLRVHVEQ